jgi:hypothetical protein
LTLKKLTKNFLFLSLLFFFFPLTNQPRKIPFSKRKGRCNSRNPETPRNPADRKINNSPTLSHITTKNSCQKNKQHNITWHDMTYMTLHKY